MTLQVIQTKALEVAPQSEVLNQTAASPTNLEQILPLQVTRLTELLADETSFLLVGELVCGGSIRIRGKKNYVCITAVDATGERLFDVTFGCECNTSAILAAIQSSLTSILVVACDMLIAHEDLTKPANKCTILKAI